VSITSYIDRAETPGRLLFFAVSGGEDSVQAEKKRPLTQAPLVRIIYLQKKIRRSLCQYSCCGTAPKPPLYPLLEHLHAPNKPLVKTIERFKKGKVLASYRYLSSTTYVSYNRHKYIHYGPSAYTPNNPLRSTLILAGT
jgi:hypothetical protein